MAWSQGVLWEYCFLLRRGVSWSQYGSLSSISGLKAFGWTSSLFFLNKTWSACIAQEKYGLVSVYIYIYIYVYEAVFESTLCPVWRQIPTNPKICCLQNGWGTVWREQSSLCSCKALLINIYQSAWNVALFCVWMGWVLNEEGMAGIQVDPKATRGKHQSRI